MQRTTNRLPYYDVDKVALHHVIWGFDESVEAATSDTYPVIPILPRDLRYWLEAARNY